MSNRGATLLLIGTSLALAVWMLATYPMDTWGRLWFTEWSAVLVWMGWKTYREG